MTRTATWSVCGVMLAGALTYAAAAPPQPGTVIRQPLLDAHNCYPDEGQFADRLSRALGTRQAQIGIEQDLVWKPDGHGGGTSVVAHSETLVGGEPTLEEHFFATVAPTMEAALKAHDTSAWPLIVLHFDFKTNELEHHRFVLSLLKKYDRWLTRAPRGRDDTVQPMTVGPLLVLTEAGDNQERDFYDALPKDEPLRIFGTVPNVVLSRSEDREEQATAAVTATPETILPSGATNYRRWANFSWAIVERGGQRRAGAWDQADAARLTALVTRAHQLGLWLRFYTLDGFAPADNQGWSNGYNFGSRAAAELRWRAAIAAGVDLIATDQYELFAASASRSSRASY